MDIVPWLIGWLGMAVVSGAGAYLGSYLSKKGENLATSEDIEKITRLQEEVRYEYRETIEKIRADEALRLVAAERRLQAYQEAYALWAKLFHGVHDADNQARVQECQVWLEENRLYLDPKIRDSFRDAFTAAHLHKGLLASPRDESTKMLIAENWKRIQKVGSLIDEAIKLPSIGVPCRENAAEIE